jgi:mRNA interferase HigB
MVHIISPGCIKLFTEDNPKFSAVLNAWVTLVSKCSWEKPQDIVNEFGPKAIDLLGKKDNKTATLSSNRVVFDIKGNHLRIIAKYQFHPSLKASRLYIKWIGTHPEYDKLCDKKLQYEVELYK